MKKLLIALGLLALAAPGYATEYGHVVRSTPVVSQVSVPQRTCWDEQVQVQESRSGAGAVVGGVVGGLLGSRFGRGDGRVASAAVGAIAGSVVGDDLDNRDTGTSSRTVQRCQTRQSSEQRTVGYDVTYEYAGQRYTTRMANPPGEWVPVNVSVDGGRRYESQSDTLYTEPVDAPPTVTYVEREQPVVVYRESPARYIAPLAIGVGLGWGWGRGWGHGYYRHDHWHH